MPSVSTGADIQPQSPRPKRCVRKVTLSKEGRVDRWRAGNEMETSKSMKRRGGREWGNNPKEQEKGGIRRIAFPLCSIKGEITHLLRFFLKTTAPIDQTAWMYRPIFNMKYRHQKSITPVFSLSLLLSAVLTCSFWLRLKHLHHCLLSSLHLSQHQAMDLPTVPPWHLHYVIRRYTCLTNGEVDHIQ